MDVDDALPQKTTPQAPLDSCAFIIKEQLNEYVISTSILWACSYMPIHEILYPLFTRQLQLSSSALSFAYVLRWPLLRTIWTQIKLLPKEQSDQGS